MAVHRTKPAAARVCEREERAAALAEELERLRGVWGETGETGDPREAVRRHLALQKTYRDTKDAAMTLAGMCADRQKVDLKQVLADIDAPGAPRR